jgi:hypothetical protein
MDWNTINIVAQYMPVTDNDKIKALCDANHVEYESVEEIAINEKMLKQKIILFCDSNSNYLRVNMPMYVNTHIVHIDAPIYINGILKKNTQKKHLYEFIDIYAFLLKHFINHIQDEIEYFTYFVERDNIHEYDFYDFPATLNENLENIITKPYIYVKRY